MDVLSGAPQGLFALLCGTACAATRLFDKALYLRAAAPWATYVGVYVLANWVLLGVAQRLFAPAGASEWADLLVRAPGTALATALAAAPHALGVPAPAQRVRSQGRLDGPRLPRTARPLVNRLTTGAPPSDGMIERRLTGAALLVVAAWMLLLTRLFYLQVVQGDVYKVSAERNSVRTQRVLAPRGALLDRYGEILVDSRPAFEVRVVPNETDDVPATLTRIAGLTGRDLEVVKKSYRTCRAGARASSRSASRTISIATRSRASKRGSGRSAVCSRRSRPYAATATGRARLTCSAGSARSAPSSFARRSSRATGSAT